MVAHSFVLDGQGLPYFAEYCFYYLAGLHDQARACITFEDVGADVKAILTEVEKIEDVSGLLLYEGKELLIDLMEKGGCDLPRALSNKSAILESIVLNEALNKRRIYLDAIAAGLEVLGVKILLHHFPDQMKPVLVSSTKIKTQDVINQLLLSSTRMKSHGEARVWAYLIKFIEESSEADLKAFICYVTGSPVPVGKIVVTFAEAHVAEAIAANTCGRQLTLSSVIQDGQVFIDSMRAIISDTSFTMP